MSSNVKAPLDADPRTRAEARPKTLARAAHGVAALAAVALLSGCMVGPDYQTPSIVLPSHWGTRPTKAKARPAQLHRWWARFRDPVLDSLMETAAKNNLDVATAKAAIRQARASYREATGGFFPSLTGSGSATSNKSTSTSGSSGGSNYGAFDAGFDASWELDLFGGNHRSAEASWYAVNAANEDLRATLLTLIGDVASNYVQARGYQALEALARRTAASQRETASLTRKKFEAGASSAVDTSKASAQAASTEADIPTYRISYEEVVHRLGVLLGEDPNAVAKIMATPRPIPKPELPMPKGVPADILMSRPDVRKAEWQYAQYTAKVGVAEAARYPSISLTGEVATSGVSIGDLAKASSISWSIGPSLSVPLFNAGKLKAAVDVAKAARDQYYLAFRAAVLSALEDVENASVSLTQEQIKRRRLATSVAYYRRADTLSQSLYRSGSSSFLDVLDTQRSLYSAQEALIQSDVNLAIDYIALNKALGGGWDGAVDSSKPVIIDVKDGPRVTARN